MGLLLVSSKKICLLFAFVRSKGNVKKICISILVEQNTNHNFNLLVSTVLSIWRALREGERIVPLSILFLLWIYNDHLTMNNEVKWVAPSKQLAWFNYILYSIHGKNKARFPPLCRLRSSLVIEPRKELEHATIGLKLNIFEWTRTHIFPVTTTPAGKVIV